MRQTNEIMRPVDERGDEPRETDRGEGERARAADELIRQFEDLNPNDQGGVRILLEKMVQEKKGDMPLSKAINSVGEKLLTEESWTGGEEVKDGRVQALCLLSRRENELVGRIFTVSEVIEILDKTIFFNASRSEKASKESKPAFSEEERKRSQTDLISWFDGLEKDDQDSVMRLLSLMIYRSQISLPFDQAIDSIAERREIDRYWRGRSMKIRGEDNKKDELFDILTGLNKQVGQVFTGGEMWAILHNKK